jgi:hypothetical protein
MERQHGTEAFAAVQEPEWESTEPARREGRPTAGAVTQDDPDPQYGDSVTPYPEATTGYLTLAGFYEDLGGADSARAELERKGFVVQAVGRRGDGPEEGTNPIITGPGYGLSAPDQKPPEGGERLGSGVAVGATIGGTIGLLSATYFIPGVGSPATPGPLLSTLAGAGLGSMLGGMFEFGTSSSDATLYAPQAGRGGVILMVRTRHQDADEARAILNRWGPLDLRVQ